MRHGSKGLLCGVVGGLSLLAVIAQTSAALAVDEAAPAAADKAAAAPPKATVAQVPQEEPAPAPSTKPVASADQPQGLVVWLPASAYPRDPIPGLEGGSLALTTSLHGMQWPYYPKTGLGLSGSVWADTGYEAISRGNPNEQGQNELIQQGRFVLRATPTWSDGTWFAQGQGEFVANKNQETSAPVNATADDAWVKVGMWKAFDLQVGRFQGWEIYHYGMALDQNTQERKGALGGVSGINPPPTYGVTHAWDRQAGAGGVALHLYPAKWLRFELGSQLGAEINENTIAGRPVAIMDFGWMKLKVGGEWQKQWDQLTNGKGGYDNRGVGGALQFIVDPYIEFGANAAYAWFDHTSSADGSADSAGSGITYSAGGFVNARIIPPVHDLIIGAGVNFTYSQDKHFDPAIGRPGDSDQWLAFGALQYFLFKQVYVKAVLGYALADFNPSFTSLQPYLNKMVSGRLRFWYFF